MDSSDAVRTLGYARLYGFLGAATVATLQTAVDDALQAPPMAGCERPHSRLAALRWNDPIVAAILGHAERRRTLRQLLGGHDLRWISGYVITKDPKAGALWWHQDWWCWNHPVSLHPDAPQVALLCYLSDTNSATGALRVLPGSHRRSIPLHSLLPDAYEQGEDLPSDHPAVSDQPDQLTLNLRAGDAVALDYRLLHGTHPNRSEHRRDCVMLSLTPSWSRLPDNVRAHLIQHLALPQEDETAEGSPVESVVPSFDGPRTSLDVDVVAPSHFIAGAAPLA